VIFAPSAKGTAAAPFSSVDMVKRSRRLEARTRPIRVLIVDDHALFAEALMLTLAIDRRIEVVGHASNGFEAVSLARALEPEVVLMDLHMPGMDGIEATKTIRRALPGVRVMIVTASQAPEHARWAREAGAVRYVTKDTPALALVDLVLEIATLPSPNLLAFREREAATLMPRTA
jgi:DNA-binding NarL/FixJ family response regulator